MKYNKHIKFFTFGLDLSLPRIAMYNYPIFGDKKSSRG